MPETRQISRTTTSHALSGLIRWMSIGKRTSPRKATTTSRARATCSVLLGANGAGLGGVVMYLALEIDLAGLAILPSTSRPNRNTGAGKLPPDGGGVDVELPRDVHE